MEIKGKIHEIQSPVTGESSNGQWSKQTIILETEGDYPKKIAITSWKNKPDFNKLSVGQVVNFHINIESREYNGNWYTDVKCWKYDVVGTSTVENNMPEPPPAHLSQPEPTGEELPDLPF